MSDFFISFSPRPHRADEIAWKPFQAALDEAAATDRLIVLVISASWCHWCHILDETTLSDDEVIKTINARFVATRLDADRQPDLDIRYNQGGWPTVAILSPQGVTLTGGTFLGARELLQLLGQAEAYYRGSRDQFLEKLRDFEAEVDQFLAEPVVVDETDLRAIANDVVDQCLAAYDAENPGFGDEPRFPHVDAVRLLSLDAIHENSEELSELVDRVLDAMVEGNLVDWVEGGFFRYCQYRDWTAPHTEKRLHDNALLIELFSDLSKVTEDATRRKRLLESARLAADYLSTTLALPDGGFASCQDADSDYYAQTIVGREASEAPPVDTEFFAGFNARASAALVSLADATGDDAYLDAARRTLEVVRQTCVGESHLPRRWPEAPDRPLHVSDAANYLYALLKLAARTDDAAYVAEASLVADSVIESFYNPIKKSFLDRTHGDDDRGPLRIPFAPLEENALLAQSFGWLYRKTREPRLLEIAREVVRGFHTVVPEYGVGSAPLGVAALELARLEAEA
jgi:uncharacterized protein YyaL (SSP411 family)